MTRTERAERSYRFGDFELQPERHRLLRAGAPVALGPRALAVLVLLVEHHDRLVPKDEILSVVWPDTFVEENNLSVHVLALRKALGADAITTVPGRGYRFTAVLDRPVAAPANDSTAPAPSAQATNLPQHPGALIGRDDELAELEQRIARHRLVLLGGPSGIGKTRLAIALGWRLLDRFPDGAWLVDLAPLGDPALLAGATAMALGVALHGASDPVAAIAGALAKRQLLLIFDNCEHLIGPAAALIQGLLERAPGLSILATSQEILRLPGEQVYRLNPLALPPEGSSDANGFGAVALFVELARAADRRFGLDHGNSASVVEICRRLDGIPLALEMAASRLPMLGVDGLRSRLDERLNLLSAGRRTAARRHQTLRDTVRWSHELLEPAEQILFRRLAIFAGSFSLEAAQDVAGDDPAESWELVDTLGRLIDKSLVAVEDGTAPRYRLLETLRLFALETLQGSGEAALIAERHALHYATLFDRSFESWETTSDAEWLSAHAPDANNVRAAIDWACRDPAQAALAVRLTGATSRLWYGLSLLVEGRALIERAMALISPDMPLDIVARLHRQAGGFWHDTDRVRAMAQFEQSAALYRQIGQWPDLGMVQGILATSYIFLGRFAEATAALDEAYALLSSGDRPKALLNILNHRGVLALVQADREGARARFAEALELARAQQDRVRETHILVNLGEVEFGLGNVDRAVERGREAVARSRQIERRSHLGWALGNLATYLITQGNTEEARSVAAEALAKVREEGGYIVRICLQQWALLAALDGRLREAARLLGFVDAGFAAAGEKREPTEQALCDWLLGLLTAALLPGELSALLETGAALRESEAVALVFDELAPAEFRPTRS